LDTATAAITDPQQWREAEGPSYESLLTGLAVAMASRFEVATTAEEQAESVTGSAFSSSSGAYPLYRSDGSKGGSQGKGREGLLLYLDKELTKATGGSNQAPHALRAPTQGFDTEWEDGTRFLALLHRANGDVGLEESGLMASIGGSRWSAGEALDHAYRGFEALGVPRLLPMDAFTRITAAEEGDGGCGAAGWVLDTVVIYLAMIRKYVLQPREQASRES